MDYMDLAVCCLQKGREIQSLTHSFGSNAAEPPVKFRRNMKILTSSLAASRVHEDNTYTFQKDNTYTLHEYNTYTFNEDNTYTFHEENTYTFH